MPMTISELSAIATRASIEFSLDKEGSLLEAAWDCKHYQCDGRKSISLLLALDEDGTYFHAFAPRIYNLANCPHKGAAIEAMAMIAYETPYVGYEFDPSDGEVRATIEFPLGSASVTENQLSCVCGVLCEVIDRYDTVIRVAMDSGVIDMTLQGKSIPSDSKDELRMLVEKVGGIDALRALARGETAPKN